MPVIPEPRGAPVARSSPWFTVVVAVFVTALIVSNIVAVKPIQLGELVLPAAVIVFPISYIVGDVLTEVYGYSQARRVIWLGFACNLLTVIVIWISQSLPPATYWVDNQAAFETILGFAPRLLVASFLAYLVGEFANSAVLAKLKVATRGRFLWMRTIGSTLVGQGLDSAVFISVAFWGVMPPDILPTVIVTQWLVKTGYEALATPLTYVVVNALKRAEGVDVFDRKTDLSPFALRQSKP